MVFGNRWIPAKDLLEVAWDSELNLVHIIYKNYKGKVCSYDVTDMTKDMMFSRFEFLDEYELTVAKGIK